MEIRPMVRPAFDAQDALNRFSLSGRGAQKSPGSSRRGKAGSGSIARWRLFGTSPASSARHQRHARRICRPLPAAGPAIESPNARNQRRAASGELDCVVNGHVDFARWPALGCGGHSVRPRIGESIRLSRGKCGWKRKKPSGVTPPFSRLSARAFDSADGPV